MNTKYIKTGLMVLTVLIATTATTGCKIMIANGMLEAEMNSLGKGFSRVNTRTYIENKDGISETTSKTFEAGGNADSPTAPLFLGPVRKVSE